MAKRTTFKGGVVEVKVIDHGWKRIVKEIGDLDESFVKVGVLSDAGTHQIPRTPSKNRTTTQKRSRQPINMADLAAIHEFGLRERNIPARPFMSQAFNKNKHALKRKRVKLLNSIYNKRISAKQALDRLGLFHVGHVKKIFLEGKFKPISDVTKKARERRSVGSTRPLVDQGHLRRSIDHEVVMR